MKICTKCGKRKPLDEFYTRPERLDGHDSRCKDCVNAQNRDARRGVYIQRPSIEDRFWSRVENSSGAVSIEAKDYQNHVYHLKRIVAASPETDVAELQFDAPNVPLPNTWADIFFG